MSLYSFHSPDLLRRWRVGSDADMGGLSKAYWGFVPSSSGSAKGDGGTAVFWGNICCDDHPAPSPPASSLFSTTATTPPPAKPVAFGYAGLGAYEQPLTCFHIPVFDASDFKFLAIRAREMGECSKEWTVNVRTHSYFPSHLWRQSFSFARKGGAMGTTTPLTDSPGSNSDANPAQPSGEWQTILLPFDQFFLTNQGGKRLRHQLEMDASTIKTITLSVLSQPGPFHLELDWIKAVNVAEESATTTFPDARGPVKAL